MELSILTHSKNNFTAYLRESLMVDCQLTKVGNNGLQQQINYILTQQQKNLIQYAIV